MKNMKLSLLSFLFIFSFALSYPATVHGKWFGCVHKENLDELIKLIREDFEAFKKALAMYIIRGECNIFEDGERVYVMDQSLLKGVVKLRKKGEVKGYWVPIESIQKDKK